MMHQPSDENNLQLNLSFCFGYTWEGSTFPSPFTFVHTKVTTRISLIFLPILSVSLLQLWRIACPSWDVRLKKLDPYYYSTPLCQTWLQQERPPCENNVTNCQYSNGHKISKEIEKNCSVLLSSRITWNIGHIHQQINTSVTDILVCYDV